MTGVRRNLTLGRMSSLDLIQSSGLNSHHLKDSSVCPGCPQCASVHASCSQQAPMLQALIRCMHSCNAIRASMNERKKQTPSTEWCQVKSAFTFGFTAGSQLAAHVSSIALQLYDTQDIHCFATQTHTLRYHFSANRCCFQTLVTAGASRSEFNLR